MSRVAEFAECTAPSNSALARIGRAVATPAERLAIRLARAVSRPRHAGGPPPVPLAPFALSGLDATFEELERIIFDPTMMARVERTPLGTLALPDREPPVLPPDIAALGWRRRARPARIIEVVPFGFELDMLELRLAELHDVVDRFVVAESARGYGGMRKPLYLQRNWSRYARFHAQMQPVVIDSDAVAERYPHARRDRTDWVGEDALRTSLWEQVRPLAVEPDTIMIWADVDEFLPRWFIHLVKHYECPLPMQVLAPAFRYHFGWRDPEATAGITIFDGRSVPDIDAQPQRLRALPAQRFTARGAVHMTAFLDPAVLLMKCAMTTDWEPALLPFLRNEHGEIAAMLRNGDWFGRPLAPYDAAQDREGLIPAAAALNRERFATFWPVER